MDINTPQSRYWVYDWLDENGITTVESARLLFADPVAVSDLRQRAERANQTQDVVPDGETSILTGRGIDLSSQLDCNHWACRKRQVDLLFRQVWLYFDRIIVQDSIAHEVALHWDDLDNRRDWVLSHIQMLLYLREIKADSLLHFRVKPPGCVVHLKRHTEEAGLSHVFEFEDKLVRELEAKAEISTKTIGRGAISYRLNHPAFVHTRWGEIPKRLLAGTRPKQLRRLIVRQEIREFLAFLNSDVISARESEAPLGAVIPLHRRLLESSHPISAADVALSLDLPVLNGIAPEVLIEIRKNEKEHFTRFRNRLRLAIQERIKTAESPNAQELALEIRRDLIDTELTSIRDRLSASERTMVKKSAVGVFLGALATTCGLISGLPASVAVSAGVAATLGMTQAATSKYLEEEGNISLSDMYFAWKAMQHADD